MWKRMMPLKALRPHLYGTRRLEAGDEYEAPLEEAIALVANRRADFAKPRKAQAIAPTAPEPEPEPAPPDINSLRLEATQLGINIDGRWGVTRLQHEIEQARQNSV